MRQALIPVPVRRHADIAAQPHPPQPDRRYGPTGRSWHPGRSRPWRGRSCTASSTPRRTGEDRPVPASQSLGPKQPTLSYHLVEVKLELADDEEPIVVTSKVVWDGMDERTMRARVEAANRTARRWGASPNGGLDRGTGADRDPGRGRHGIRRRCRTRLTRICGGWLSAERSIDRAQ